MSILRNLERIKARRKANSKETRCDIDVTKAEFPQLRESTVCSIRSKYEEELKVVPKQKRESKSVLPVGQRGRPLMLGKINLTVQNYLQVCYVSINRLIFCP